MATQLIVKYEQVWEPKRPYTCECGVNTTLGNRFRHNKTLIKTSSIFTARNT